MEIVDWTEITRNWGDTEQINSHFWSRYDENQNYQWIGNTSSSINGSQTSRNRKVEWNSVSIEKESWSWNSQGRNNYLGIQEGE